MKIGIDISRITQKEKTGVEWYAYFLIAELKTLIAQMNKDYSDKKIDVILYTNKPLKGVFAELPEGWQEKVLKWPPKRLWTHVRLSWEMLFHTPDVLFIPAHVVPLIHPKKTVMVVHDIASTKFPNSYNWFERWYSLWSVQYALRHVWKIITPSIFTREEMTKTWKEGKQKNIIVIYHGYNTHFNNIIDEKDKYMVMKKYGLQKPFIMSIGRLEKKKNTCKIIETFEMLKNNEQKIRKNVQLLLVGKPGFGYEDIKEKIKHSEYKKDIKIPGWVDQEDLSILLASADVFVFPSLYEGFGLPVLEAMACGTPVVASQGTSLEEVGGDAVTYVDPMSSDDIASAILNVMNNEEYRKEQIKKGLERVKEFSWERCARETLQVLCSD